MAHLQNWLGLLVPWHCDHPPLVRKSR